MREPIPLPIAADGQREDLGIAGPALSALIAAPELSTACEEGHSSRPPQKVVGNSVERDVRRGQRET